LKNAVSPGVIVAIVVVVLLVIGGIGYSIFYSKGGGTSSAEGAAKTKEMQANQTQIQQDQMGKHSGAGGRGPGGDNQRMMQQNYQNRGAPR